MSEKQKEKVEEVNNQTNAEEVNNNKKKQENGKKVKSRKLIKFIKLVLFALFVAAVAFFAYKLFPMFYVLATEEEGRTIFRDYIRSFGPYGVIVLGLVEFIKMFLIVLPEEPIELIAGMCYGPIGGLLVMLASIYISNFIIFTFSKKLGKSFVEEFVPKEKLKKVMKNKLLRDKKGLEYSLWIIFFIPYLPKDIFTYIGGLLPINGFKFALIATLARIPTIIASTLAGSSILNGNMRLFIASYVITLGFSIGAIMFLTRKNKKIVENLKKLDSDIK